MKKKSMKTRHGKNPLHLGRETVRQLEGQQLRQVAGGPVPPDDGDCTCHCCTCHC